ncbi:MAG TPA: histidine kinase [Pyrinomonadaceae bacterium]|nr:histidine kinase [Pyrinomonadaceae bacterium]
MLRASVGRRYCGAVRFAPRFRPWMIVSAAWILPAIFAAINRIVQAHLQGWEPATVRDVLFEGGDWFVYALLTPGVFAVSKRWPVVRPHLLRRALIHLLFSILFCVAWATCGQILRFVLMLIFARDLLNQEQFWQQFAVQWLSWIFITLPFGVAVYLCVVGVEHAIRYFVEVREREVQLARLSEQLAGARFAALQAQVNPHFLFNTLNTIAVLVRDDDRQGAVRIVEHLSELLRRTLSRHQENEVSLGEELELVRQYVAIEQARFSDRLRPEFRVDDSLLAAMVPSFSLQHLVENAIRHGIARDPDAGSLIVAAERLGDMLEITVTDDGAGIDPDAAIPPGHGIDNTRERLRALYGEDASLQIVRRPEGGTIARLRVPQKGTQDTEGSKDESESDDS